MNMSKMIQIRNVPNEIHRSLKIRAAEEGMSLSDFLLKEVAHIINRPSVEEIIERIKSRGSVKLNKSSAKYVREEREKN